MNAMAIEFLGRRHRKPWSLFFAHKAVHPDAEQAADGTLKVDGYGSPTVTRTSTRAASSRRSRTCCPYEDVIMDKPAWREAFELQDIEGVACDSRRDPCRQTGGDPAARGDDGGRRRRCRNDLRGARTNRRARQDVRAFPRRQRLFLRRARAGTAAGGLLTRKAFAPHSSRAFRSASSAGMRLRDLVICQDIAPTLIELAGGKPGKQIQGRSLAASVPGRACGVAQIGAARVLGRERLSMARQYDVQSGAHPALQVHPLGQPQPRRRAR